MVSGGEAADALAVTAATLGERLRLLRRSAGLTQSELAAGRVSKEYISQVEHGKTKPSRKMLELFAERLGVDTGYLAVGISSAEYGRAESILAAAEALAANHDDDAAVPQFRRAAALVAPSTAPELALRATRGEVWSLLELGRLAEAEPLLDHAAAVADGKMFSDTDRGDIAFCRGVCRYRQSRITEAISLLDSALRLADRSPVPSDGLRSDVYHWRSRCYRRHSDWDSARSDIDHAIELAEAIGDRRRAALAYFQASLVAEREGRWILARSQAETAKALFEELGDGANVGRLLNNLAGLNHLLGNSERAITLLRESYEAAVETGLEPDAGHVMCSLAEIFLDQGQFEAAERDARKALVLLADRTDYLHEIGITQLTLARALTGQDKVDEAERFINAAETSFGKIDSTSHQATAWIARGELLERRGDIREAAAVYRRAAVGFQQQPPLT
jgi:tetratricopeptide (TPR) repeat protein